MTPATKANTQAATDIHIDQPGDNGEMRRPYTSLSNWVAMTMNPITINNTENKRNKKPSITALYEYSS